MKKKRNCRSRTTMRVAGKIFLTMKLTLSILLLCVFQLSASVYSQNARLTIELKNRTVKEVLQAIEEKSDYRFFYNEQFIDLGRKVSVTSEDLNIETILNEVFEGAKVSFKVMENNLIIITPTEGIQQQQLKTISGKVTDAYRSPLPGVSVVIKGTTNGTISDTEGNFTLTNVPSDAVLVLSFVGMRTQEISVVGKTSLSIIMAEDAIGIEEVVAVGYGTQKKVNLTGAVSVITGETLENRPIATTGQGLQGVIPNLNVNFTSGDPADRAVDYNIRGFESINGGSPYILIDGVPMNIEDINPNDIESISVLKDASASAIYGGKAAFGVILVTTKSARGKDKIMVKYSNETALSSPILKGLDPVDNSYDYVFYKNLMYTNDGSPQRYDDDYVAAVKAYYENPGSNPEYAILDNNFEFYGYNDYKDIMMRDFSPSYKHNLSISGGTEKTNFFVSLGNFTKEGIFKFGTDKYIRNNILLKANQNIAKWISLDQKVAVNLLKTDQPHDYGVNAIGPAAAHLYGSTVPLKFPDNVSGYEEFGGMYFDNAVGYMDLGSRTVNKSFDTWLTAGMNLRPVKNLNIRGEVSYNYANSYKNDAVTSIDFVKESGVALADPITNGYTYPTSASMTMNLSEGYIFNTYAEYEVKDMGLHYIKAMIGFNQESRKWDRIGGTGKQLITNAVPHIGATLGDKTVGGSSDHYSLRGAFYRLNYIYNDRYLFEFSGRYDGTSRFPKDDRFGFFPSASLGWRISEESFMSGFNWLDNLKIRASYGELGNQSISYNGTQQYYPYQSTMGIATAHWFVLDASGTLPQYTTQPLLVSKSLTWETVATKDLGVDFTFLNQRLDGSFDYYIRETKDMLLKKTYPEILSAIAPWENGADLETKGWEFTISWRDKISHDFKYGLRFSLWDFTSKITKYYNPTNSLTAYYEGMEVGEIWGYETVGLFQNEEEIANGPIQSALGSGWKPGDVWYKDQLTVDIDGDGIFDEADGKINSGSNTLENHGDLIKIGNRSPRYSYSFNVDLNYKNWGFSALFQGIGKKNYYANSNFEGWYPWAVNGTIKKSDITDSWTEDNPDAYWFRATSTKTKNIATQTRYLQDASYLRLKSVVLNYTLPENLIRKIGMSKADIYVSGQNLWELSNFIYNRDPEQNTGNFLDPFEQTNGPNHISYPSQRTFSVGVNLTF